MSKKEDRSPRRPGILRCPICGAPVPYKPGAELPKAFPFCSLRCKMIDLNNWLDERYIIGRELSSAEQEEWTLQSSAPPSEETDLEALSREELLELLRRLKGHRRE